VTVALFLFVSLVAPAGRAPVLAQSATLTPGTGPALVRKGVSAALAPQTDLVQEVVVGGFTLPTAMAFLPDGRLLIAEKSGRVSVYKDGGLLPTPFIDISDHVNSYEDRGLLGIAADRDFATNHRVYLLYTYEHQASQPQGKKTARLTAVIANGDVTTGNETPILGTLVAGMPVPNANPARLAQSCADFGPNADCLPSDSIIHSIGSVRVAPDSTLFVTIGDATTNGSVDNPFRAQDLDSLSGKILHVDTNGQGVAGNPFFSGGAQTTDNRSKVWALGMRNPFRFSLRPGADPPLPYLGDVGWDNVEELNVAAAGSNLGWPCYEGTAPQVTFGGDPRCVGLTVKGPLVEYSHTGPDGSVVGSAVIGGVFYTGTTFPTAYRPGPGEGVYFYADYARDFINVLRVGANNTVIEAPRTLFSGDTGAPVDLAIGTDGNIYFLAIGSGQLRRIRPYDPTIPTCRPGQYRAEYFNNSTLAGSPTIQRCEVGSIYHPWAEGSPDPRIGADFFSARWVGSFPFDSGTYRFSGDADDGIRVFVDGSKIWDGWPSQLSAFTVDHAMPGGEHEIKVEYSEQTGGALARLAWTKIADNRPPTATITAPQDGMTYQVGDVISFAGSATDQEDGNLTDSQLAWQILLQHCSNGSSNCHQHPTVITGRSGSFLVEDHGDDTYYQLVLTGTDTGNARSAPVTRTLQPRKSSVTLTTSPPGLQLTYNSGSGVAPLVREATVGGQRIIVAPSPQVVNGVTYDFERWSDGGAASHTIIVGEGAMTLTAFFKARSIPASPSPTPALSFADVPPGYWAHDHIVAFARRGITTGCDTDAQGNRYYCPERGLTRAEMATFLTRVIEQDKQIPPATPTFADVPADYWAYGQIEAFAKLGITTGCGLNELGQSLFCPERGVTRAEMAAFLVRARGQTELRPATATFADVPPNYWAYGWIERFLALSVTTGCGEDEYGRPVYCPDRGVTRAEVATLIIRAYP